MSNFTDVDDKIINAGHEMKMTVKEVTDKFIDRFIGRKLIDRYE